MTISGTAEQQEIMYLKILLLRLIEEGSVYEYDIVTGSNKDYMTCIYCNADAENTITEEGIRVFPEKDDFPHYSNCVYAEARKYLKK